jgi:hypothetical protein
MSLILGILDSGGVAGAPNSYDSIASTTVGAGGVADITFSSIPSAYTHLQLRLFIQEPVDTVAIEFNSDTGNNYSRHELVGDGGVVVGATSSTNMIYVATTFGSSGSRFGAAVVDILDYKNTNKYKTVRSLAGVDNNTSFSKIILYSGLWQNTNAITTIKVRSRTSGTIAQYSQAALYGIKGA